MSNRKPINSVFYDRGNPWYRNFLYGFEWGWPSRSGKRETRVRVSRMARFPSKGAVLGIDTGSYGSDLNMKWKAGPQLQVVVSDAGQKVRVWLDNVEMIPGEELASSAITPQGEPS